VNSGDDATWSTATLTIVRHFVVVYDRHQRRIIGDVASFDDADEAMRARWERDGEYRGDAEIEVVVLSADSEEDLRLTHGRYFKSVAELAS
jgi:hypothetical protein